MRYCIFFGLSILFFSCSKKREIETESFNDEYSLMSLKRFTINGLNLIANRDSMVSILGMPSKESANYASNDTLRTIYYFFNGAEVAFTVKGDSVIFSHAFFESENYAIENDIGSFSARTKLDVMKLVFPESYESRTRSDDKDMLYLKIGELEGSWIRLEFVKGFLVGLHFDFFKG